MICTLFKEFYDETILQIQKFIDAKELEIDGDADLYHDDPRTPEPEHVMLLNEISSKWLSLTEEHRYLSMQLEDNNSGSMTQSITISTCRSARTCPVLKRAKFVMELYSNFFLDVYVRGEPKPDCPAYISAFRSLGGYNILFLLNDYVHIKTDHANRDDLKTLVDQECHGIHNQCSKSLFRRYRESREEEEDAMSRKNKLPFDTHLDGLGVRERLILEQSSKIHNLINHSAFNVVEMKDNHSTNDGTMLRPLQWRPGLDIEDNKYSKFVNEVQGDVSQSKAEHGHVDGICAVLSEGKLSDEDCAAFMCTLMTEGYDTESILLDIADNENDDPYNHFRHSNVFQFLRGNKYHAKLVKKHMGAQHNDDDALPQFSFGLCVFGHWQEHKESIAYVESPKYRSLREECLSNRIYKISKRQFDEVLLKARMFKESSMGKRLKAKHGEGMGFGIPDGLIISISHIFVLLTYCNNTKLQYLYKKHACRESKPIKSYKDKAFKKLKMRNREVGHWYKLLFEAVECYGSLVTEKDVSYSSHSFQHSMRRSPRQWPGKRHRSFAARMASY